MDSGMIQAINEVSLVSDLLPGLLWEDAPLFLPMRSFGDRIQAVVFPTSEGSLVYGHFQHKRGLVQWRSVHVSTGGSHEVRLCGARLLGRFHPPGDCCGLLPRWLAEVGRRPACSYRCPN